MAHHNSLLTDMYAMDDVKTSSAALNPGSTHVSTVEVINMYDEPDLVRRHPLRAPHVLTRAMIFPPPQPIYAGDVRCCQCPQKCPFA